MGNPIPELAEAAVLPATRQSSPADGTRSGAATQGNDRHDVVRAALAILEQGEELLAILSPADYCRKNPLAFNASLGGHYRHCLDHFDCLLGGLSRDEIDYDHRQRDPRIETDHLFALESTCRIRSRMEQLAGPVLNRAVTVRCEVSYGSGKPAAVQSTVLRELVYAIAHAIHHYALMAVIARMNGTTLPEHFGIAPSTVAYLSQQAVPPAASA